MQQTVTVAERIRSFTVFGEPGGDAARPLVLVFHGSKQDGSAHRRFTGDALGPIAREGRAVVAYLDGVQGNWNDARRESGFPARRLGVDDVAFARAVVEQLITTHGIDAEAVVGVGYSNGGQMVLRLLHEAPSLLDGAIVVAATMPDRAGFLGEYSTTGARGVPTVVVGGTRDRIVPFEGGRMRWWVRRLFSVDGVTLSALETARYLAARNGITAAPAERALPAEPGDRTRTTVTEHRQTGRASVTLYSVHGGGHTVPGATPAPRALGRTGRAHGIAAIVEDVLRELRSS